MPITINGSTGLTGVAAIDNVSSTELGYVDGVTSAIQTQLAGKADTTGNGAWTAWTPTVTSVTGSITSYTLSNCRYVRLGKLVIASGQVQLTNAGTGAGTLKITAPVTAYASLTYAGSASEVQLTGQACSCWLNSTTEIAVNKYDGTTIIATGRYIAFTICYEAA